MKRTAFIRTVRYLLIDGFGVEDIALRIGCDVSEVRALVAVFRSHGALDRIFGARSGARS